MKTTKSLRHDLLSFIFAATVVPLFAGCQSASHNTTSQPVAATAREIQSAPVTSVENNTALPTIRIDAGATDGFTDNSGHEWLPDQGFADGETIERPDLTITNAAAPRLYQSERYNMTKFTQPLPDGKYIVKLHFCETYDGITGPGERVFSFNVAGQEFKGFDVWAKAGGPQRACVETVPVTITNGILEITFTPDVENPQINGIEILPHQQ